MSTFRIIEGDVLEVMRELASGSFDACLTDPPYALGKSDNMRRMSPDKKSRDKASGFMGMKWDSEIPGPEVWRELLRTLKPGGPLLAFGGARTFHRLACAIEDGGFQLADTLCWLHGQGFPKSKAQLKPAWEPITLAWKESPGRVLNIDGCRIDGTTGLGRWPANVILGDEETEAAIDEQSGLLTSGNNPSKRSADKHRNVYAGWKGEQCLVHRKTDSGGASRFFYCAKAKGAERADNEHPTVKALELTEYLGRLLLVDGKSLLVPYSGSGSEMIGALRAGWPEVVGIEREPKYIEIARRRLRAEGFTETEVSESAKLDHGMPLFQEIL